MIAWNKLKITKADMMTIGKIAKRAASLYAEHGADRAQMDIAMDLEAVHGGPCPLRLDDLLAADDFNLMHDVSGIANHLNRETGELGNCFSPRFSAR